MNRGYNTHLHAAKGKSKASSSTSAEQIQEMAAFLSIQLLEKVMAEAMKPEGESTIDLDSIERLTNALQKSSPTPSASDEDSGHVEEMGDIGTDSNQVATIEDTKEETVVVDDSTADESIETEVDGEATSEPAIDDDLGDDTDVSIENKKIPSETETTISEEPVESKTEVNADPLPTISQPTASIPEIVRSPLEVVESGIPPLRPESIPRRDIPVPLSSSDMTEAVAEEVTTPTLPDETLAESKATEIADPEVVEEEIDTAGILERKKAEELFHRRLLQQKLAYDKLSTTRKSLATSTDSEATEAPTTADDLESVTEAEEAEEDSNPTQGESNAESIIAEEMEAELQNLPLTNTTPPPISDRRIETIVALRQPKSIDEEWKLAEKYSKMENLEDRAYAVLCDLGMVEEHKDPRDPSYDHSKDDELCDQRFLPLL